MCNVPEDIWTGLYAAVECLHSESWQQEHLDLCTKLTFWLDNVPVMPQPDWESLHYRRAHWYTVNSDGEERLWEAEPVIGNSKWIMTTPTWSLRMGIITLPLGIDWRLTKQRRPENDIL